MRPLSPKLYRVSWHSPPTTRFVPLPPRLEAQIAGWFGSAGGPQLRLPLTVSNQLMLDQSSRSGTQWR